MVILLKNDLPQEKKGKAHANRANRNTDLSEMRFKGDRM